MTRLAVLGFVLLATFAACGQPEEPAATEQGPRETGIVFITESGGVALIRPGGEGLRHLAGPSVNDDGAVPASAASLQAQAAERYSWPAWSPSGERFAVSRQPGVTGDNVAALVVFNGEGGSPLVVHETPPGPITLIADGAPHYAQWSPDGLYLSFVAPVGDGGGLGLFLAGPDMAAEPRLLARDAPLYHAWSPDSAYIVIHRREQLLMHDVDAGEMADLGRDAISYRVATFDAGGERLAYVADIGQGPSLVVRRQSDHAERSYVRVGSEAAFAFSPAGGSIVVGQRNQQLGGLYDGVDLIDLASGETRRLVDGAVRAFYWSPGGSRLAAVRDPGGGRPQDWVVVELDGAGERLVSDMTPATTLITHLTFFDQFAQSHPVWSPDGAMIAFGGDVPGGDPPEPGAHSRIWVVNVAGGAPPIDLARGSMPAWAMLRR